MEMELDGHAGFAETLGIGEILVTEDIELAHLEVAGGQAGQIAGQAAATVLNRGGIRVFGSQSVVHGEHDDATSEHVASDWAVVKANSSADHPATV